MMNKNACLKIFISFILLFVLVNSQTQVGNNPSNPITEKSDMKEIVKDQKISKEVEMITKGKNKGFTDGLVSGFSIVFFAEVGDRTFILIMIYSISNSYFKTFLISNVILLTWNILSILIGLNMQYYINRDFVEWFGIALFAIFGILMIHDGFNMESRFVEEEFMEEEENLRKKAEKKYISNDNDEEKNVNFLKNDNNLKENLINKSKEGTENKNLFNSIWAFGFSLLMAEFGDKSQIAAIIIGATLNLFGVIIGTSLAHMICSIIAIVFGRIFSKYITNKQITMIGGIIFLLFALIFLIEKL